MDAPGATSTNTFGGDLYRQRAGLPDPIVASARAAYSNGLVRDSFSATAGQTFKARASWSFSGAQSGTPSGYSSYSPTTTDFRCDLT